MDILIQSQLQSQIFFFISSVGFIVLGVFVAILLFYLIRISHTFSRIIDKMEKDIDNIGDITEELLEDMRDSSLFRFFFGRKKRRNKN